MIKAEFTLNGVKVSKQIPMAWDELPFGKFVALSEAGTDRSKVLAILSDIDHETIKTAQISNFNALMQLVSWVFIEFPQLLLPSKLTMLNGHTYWLPKDLEITTYDRYTDLDNLVRTEDNIVSKYPLIAATYIVNPYHYKDAEALAEQISLYGPCTEVMAIGNFTVANILGLRNTMRQIVPKPDTPLNRLKQALRNFLKRLVVTAHYYSLRRRLPSSVRRYSLGR